MDELATSAVAAAVEVAGRHGLRNLAPQLMKDGSNAMVHLAPSPVVARVATTGSWLRKPVEHWLQRDLDLATYLVQQGTEVVPPSGELPPGPHISSPATGSMAMTFWTFVEVDRDHPATAEEAAASLGELHRTLRGYSGELPFLGVLLKELPHWLRWLEDNRALPAADLIVLRQAHWELSHTLLANRLPLQALHGDAHSGNLLRTPGGLLWLDFEDACTGPVAWDVATLVARNAEDADHLLAAYPSAPAWRELLPFLQARELEAVVYHQVLGRRFPQRAPEAAAALAAWHKKWAA